MNFLFHMGFFKKKLSSQKQFLNFSQNTFSCFRCTHNTLDYSLKENVAKIRSCPMTSSLRHQINLNLVTARENK